MLVSAEGLAHTPYQRVQVGRRRRIGVVRPAAIRGLRDLGYRDTAAAVCALVDNAIEARARRVDILVQETGGDVTSLAVIDDGVGMVPEMIRAACAPGASCKLGEGPHLARSGFGLPSAPLAIGRRFSILSRASGGGFHAVEMDMSDVAAPAATPTQLPPFVASHLGAASCRSGSAVLIDEIDRAKPQVASALRAELKRRLGLVFQNWMPEVALHVDGEIVRPIDPLHLTRGASGYSGAWGGAVSGPAFTIDCAPGRVSVRSAWFPAASDENPRRAPSVAFREDIHSASEGLIVSRLGRRLTYMTQTPFWRWTAADAAWRLEIDFTPDLDPAFGPTLNLEAVRVAATMWERLRAAGLDQTIEVLRRMTRRDHQDLRLGAAAASVRTGVQRRRNRCLNGEEQ